MSPTSAWPAIIGLALVIALGIALEALAPQAPKAHRYQSVDGLRGYLAFAVYLHHACIWYYYLHGVPWSIPPSRLYTHFGQTGVSLFFMITGLLFYSKILDRRGNGVDWVRLYVSRVLRLTPLYLVACAALLLFVAILSSHNGLKEPLSQVTIECLRWLTFTLTGTPDINGVPETGTTVAYVFWSLRYEWLFYCMLPLTALIAGHWPGWGYLALAIASLGVLLAIGRQPVHPASFLVGMISALLSRVDSFTRLARTSAASVIAVVSLVAAVALYPSPQDVVPFLLVGGVFVLLACGNTLWGSLTSPPSRRLGDLSYGIYLLHGLLLFALFTFILSRDQGRQLDAAWHWVAALSITPFLILLSAVAYRYVERPAIDRTAAVTAYWRRIVTRRRPVSVSDR